MKSLILDKILSDDEMVQREGEYFDSTHYKYIITDNIDVYKKNGDLLFKFRKKFQAVQMDSHFLR